MKKNKLNLIAFLLLLTILVGLFPFGGVRVHADTPALSMVEQIGDLTLKVNFGFDMTTTNSRYPEFDNTNLTALKMYSGEAVYPLVKLDVSALKGSQQELSNAKMIISFPSQYASVTPLELKSASHEVIKDEVNGITKLIYTFPVLKGSIGFQLPVPTLTSNGQTPDGYVLPYTLSFFKADQTQIGSSLVINSTHYTTAVKVTKVVLGQNVTYIDRDGNTFYAGSAEPGQPTLVNSDISKTQDIDFGFWQSERWINGATKDSGGTGRREMKAITLIDYLPQEAKMSPNCDSRWVYNAGTHSATFTLQLTGPPGPGLIFPNGLTYLYTSYRVPPLKLRFPGATVNTDITNRVKMIMEPKDQQVTENLSKFTDEDTLTFKLTSSLPQGVFSKQQDVKILDHPNIKGLLHRIVIHYVNRTTLSVENFTVSDSINDLDPLKSAIFNHPNRSKSDRMNFAGIGWNAHDTASITGTMTIVAIDRQGGEHVLASEANPATVGEVLIPEALRPDIARIECRSNPGTVIPVGGQLRLNAICELKNPAEVSYDEAVIQNNYLPNRAEIKYRYTGQTIEQQGAAWGFFSLQPYKPMASIGKSIYPFKSTYSATPGQDVISFLSLFANAYGTPGLVANDKIFMQYIVDLLPSGIEYIPSSARWAGGYSEDGVNLRKYIEKLEPDVIPNYKNSGRTALMWKFKPGGLGPNIVIPMQFDARVTRELEPGTHENQIFAVWDNNGFGSDPNIKQILPAGGSNRSIVEDLMDIDNDGNTTEKIIKAVASFTCIAPREVVTAETVKGNEDNAYTLAGAKQELGTDGFFRIKWNNYFTDPVNNYGLLTTLPHTGDLAIVANKEGEYIARESEFNVYLTGPVVIPDAIKDDYDIFYSTELVSKNPKGFYQTDTYWTKTPSGYRQVRAVKLMLKAGKSIPGLGSSSIELPIHVDYDKSLTEGMIAWSSVAQTLDDGNNFQEARKTSLTIKRYAVNGNVWMDADQNSVIEADITKERKFKNVRVILLDEHNQIVNDPDGHPHETVTDDNGDFAMDVFRSGEYKLAYVNTDPRYTATAKGNDAEKTQSHIDPSVLDLTLDGQPVKAYVTELFSLNAEFPLRTRNAGLHYDFAELEITKTLKSYEGNPINEARSFNFTLTVNGALYSGPMEIDGTVTQINAGKLSFKNGEVVKIYGITPGYAVSLVEVPDAQYKVEATGNTIAAAGAAQLYKISFVNTEQAIGKITVNKTLTSSNNNPIDEKRTFNFKIKGKSFNAEHPDGLAFSIQNGDSRVFDNLIPDTYTVTESNEHATKYDIEAAKEVVITSANREHTLSFNNKEKDLGVLTIRKELTTQDLIQSLKNRVFSFKLTGPKFPAGTEFTLNAGAEKVFTELPYGDYQVTEAPSENFKVSYAPSQAVKLTLANPFFRIVASNEYQVPLRNIEISKNWIGGEAQGTRPDVTVRLLANGGEVKSQVLTKGQSSFKFIDLPATMPDGSEIAYSITEDAVQNYDSQIDGFKMTNTFRSPKRSLEILKVWKLVRKRVPNIEIQLYRNGEPLGEPRVLVSGQNKLIYEVDSFDPSGTPYVYTVDEVNVPERYIKEVSGLMITNTFDGPEVENNTIGKPEFKPNTPSPTSGDEKKTDGANAAATSDKPMPRTGEANSHRSEVMTVLGLGLLLALAILRRRSNS